MKDETIYFGSQFSSVCFFGSVALSLRRLHIPGHLRNKDKGVNVGPSDLLLSVRSHLLVVCSVVNYYDPVTSYL